MSTKTSDLTALTGTGAAATDVLYIVATGTGSKKITLAEFVNALLTIGSADMADTDVTAADDDLIIGDGGAGGTAKRISVANLAGAVARTLECGIEAETATNIGSAAHAINATGKYVGKTVFDSTNGELLRASGTGATDAWTNCSGGSDITPS